MNASYSAGAEVAASSIDGFLPWTTVYRKTCQGNGINQCHQRVREIRLRNAGLGSPASYSSIHCEISERNCIISATAFSMTSAMSMVTPRCTVAGSAALLRTPHATFGCHSEYGTLAVCICSVRHEGSGGLAQGWLPLRAQGKPAAPDLIFRFLRVRSANGSPVHEVSCLCRAQSGDGQGECRQIPHCLTSRPTEADASARQRNGVASVRTVV